MSANHARTLLLEAQKYTVKGKGFPPLHTVHSSIISFRTLSRTNQNHIVTSLVVNAGWFVEWPILREKRVFSS